MVKAELTIEFKDGGMNLGLDLLKREDATDDEFAIAQAIQENLLIMIGLMKDLNVVKEEKREIIK